MLEIIWKVFGTYFETTCIKFVYYPNCVTFRMTIKGLYSGNIYTPKFGCKFYGVRLVQGPNGS